MPIVMYFVRGLNDGELVRGGYYENMLQPIRQHTYRFWVVDRKKENGRVMHRLNYMGFSPNRDRWVTSAELTRLRRELRLGLLGPPPAGIPPGTGPVDLPAARAS